MNIKGFINACVAALFTSHLFAQASVPTDIRVALNRQQMETVSALSGASKIEGNEILKRRWTKNSFFLLYSRLPINWILTAFQTT